MRWIRLWKDSWLHLEGRLFSLADVHRVLCSLYENQVIFKHIFFSVNYVKFMEHFTKQEDKLVTPVRRVITNQYEILVWKIWSL